MRCPNCQFENPPNLLFCGKCGTQLSTAGDISATQTLHEPLKELSKGRLFAGRFEIIGELGKGGMGTVYHVHDKKIDEEIALKLLKPEIASDAKTIIRFKNELKLARKISHKSVCRMYDLNEEDGNHYITMEYVAGEDLKVFTKREGQLSAEKVISFAKQISQGLMEAHRLGIVHRDLKPQNIMIDQDENVHIMDFGIARMISASELTEKGAIIGTPYYMSPEQVEGETVDQRADIYSLGVILYEMVTGRAPFKGDSALSVALKHKTEIPKDPQEFNAQIPESISRLILKCMEKDKEQRFQNAEQLSSALEDVEKEITGEVDVPLDKKPGAQALDERERMKSIAVLPFKDMSPHQDQAYFCEGLAEELINALTQINDLNVAARTSSFSFKGKDTDIREIGKTLNVKTVLEGSVQKSGNHLRITAQLINVADGYHLWSERFDRAMDDIFSIQDEISMAVVNKLKGELLEEEVEKVTKRFTEDKDAHNLLLKGRYFWNRRYQGDMIKAVNFYQKAIDKDPNYALPYVGIADVFNILGQWAFIRPREAYAKSKAMLQKAMEIDSSLSEVYSSLAFMTMGYEWDFAAAENYLHRSIELNPQNAIAHGWHAEMLATAGKKEEAIEEARKAIECDPLFSLIHSLLGVVLAITGRVEEGREQIDKAIAMDPDQPMPYLFQGMICLLKPADPEKAIEHLQKPAAFGMAFAYGWMAAAYALTGQREKVLEILHKLEKIEKEHYIPPLKKLGVYLKPGLKHFRFMKRKYVAPLVKTMVYLALNEQEKALEWLERSSQERDYFFPATITTMDSFDFPWAEEFRNHERFKALQSKIKGI